MPHTTTFTVDNIGNPEPVQPPIACSRVTIREQGAAGTTDYLVRRPTSTSPAYRKVSGESFTFTADPPNKFQANEIIGYVETVTGSITMSMECE